MEITLRQIRYFVAAAEAGQVSRAARDLNVSQSAVTVAIRAIEAALGSRLFERHPSGVRLTHEGSLFAESARGALRARHDAMSPPRGRGAVSGPIRLAATYTVLGYFLPPLLARFCSAHPGVRVDLVEADRPAIEEGLAAGRLDAAVMLTSNVVDAEEVAYQTLIRSPRRLWLPSRHPLLEAGRATLRDVSHEPYIMPTVDEASATAQRYWSRSSHRPSTILRTSSTEAVRSMVANGMGVAILSDLVYRPWSLEGRRIEAIPVIEPVPTMDVGIAWAAEADLSPQVAALRDFLRLSAPTP